MQFKAVTSLIFFIIILTACSGNGDENENTASDADEDVTIVYSSGEDRDGFKQKIVDEFEKKHENINVEFNELPNDSGQQHESYITSLSSESTEPDVFDIDVIWPGELAQADYILPLDRYIQQDDVDLDMYNEGALSASKYKGKQWALPRYMDVALLFYRKDIIDEPPETWDELTEMAKEHKGEKGTKYGYAFQGKQYEGLVTNTIELISAYGGEVLDDDDNVAINSDETVKALKKLKELSSEDIAPEDITSFEEPDTETAFSKGDAVFTRHWPDLWETSNNEEESEVIDEVGVAPLPKGDSGSYGTLGGWQTAINKYSEHKDAAWEFLKFATGEEGQKIMAMEGSQAPTIDSLYDDEEITDSYPFLGNEEFQEAIKGAVPRPVTANYQEVSDIIQNHASNVIVNEESAEEAAENMEKEIKESIKEE